MNTFTHRLALIALLPVALILTAPACGDDGDTGDAGTGDVPGVCGDQLCTLGSWTLSMDGATWVEPDGASALTDLMTSDLTVLLGSSGESSTNDNTFVNLTLATGDAAGQNMCNRTVAMTQVGKDDTGGLSRSLDAFYLANGIHGRRRQRGHH